MTMSQERKRERPQGQGRRCCGWGFLRIPRVGLLLLRLFLFDLCLAPQPPAPVLQSPVACAQCQVPSLLAFGFHWPGAGAIAGRLPVGQLADWQMYVDDAVLSSKSKVVAVADMTLPAACVPTTHRHSKQGNPGKSKLAVHSHQAVVNAAIAAAAGAAPVLVSVLTVILVDDSTRRSRSSWGSCLREALAKIPLLVLRNWSIVRFPFVPKYILEKDRS